MFVRSVPNRSENMPQDRKNAANIRGDIQKGLTGDKKPGFDPAAAPLETDSEAGGAPLGPEHVRVARQEQHPRDQSDRQDSTAEAMLPFEGPIGKADKTYPWRTGLLVVAGIIVLAAAWLAFGTG